MSAPGGDDAGPAAGRPTRTVRGRGRAALRWPSRVRPDHAVLVVTVAVHLALAHVYAAATPPWETPDEPWHMGLIVWLRETRRLPPLDASMLATPLRQEASQAPLYYVAAAVAGLRHAVDQAALAAAFVENPTRFKGVGLAPKQHNYALHGPWDAPERPIIRALRAARAVAALFGALAVVAVWRLARRLRPRRPWFAVACAAMAAAQPQLVYLSAAASNDTAVAALATLALGAVVAFPARPSTAAAARLGAWYGLAALAKSSALALGPLIAAAMLAGAWRSAAAAPDRWRRATAATLRWGVAAAGAAMAAGGWWYLRNLVRFGTLFGRELHLAMPWAHAAPHSLSRLVADHAFDLLFMSYWAVFGWGTVRYPRWTYGLVELGVAAAGVGLVVAAVRSRHAWRSAAAARWLLCAAWAILSFVALVAWMRLVEANWGRLLFPALGAITVLLAAGLDALPPRGRWPALASAALLAWSATAPAVALRRAFGPPRLLAADDVAALEGRLAWRMGDVVTLLAARPLEPQALANPGFWPIELCWRAEAVPPFEPSVFVHLVGARDRIVASYDGTPGGGTWPGGAWRPGDTVCERVDVAIGDDDGPVPAPAVYRVAIGMFDRVTGARMATTDAAGRPVVGNFAGTVKVAGPATGRGDGEDDRADDGTGDGADNGAAPGVAGPAPDATAAAVSATRFGEGPVDIRLRRLEAPDAVCAGGTLSVTLGLDVVGPPGEDLQLMLHLRPPGDDRPIAQGDAPLSQRGLPYPSSAWSAGERLDDVRPIAVPTDAPPGRYEVAFALYRLADLGRLALAVDGRDVPARAVTAAGGVAVRRCR